MMGFMLHMEGNSTATIQKITLTENKVSRPIYYLSGKSEIIEYIGNNSI